MRAKSLSLPLALALALGGCDDMLTEAPESFITTDTYYRTPQDIENAALAMYSLFLDWNMFKVQYHWTFELAADQGRFHPDEPNVETQAPEYLNWTTTSRDAIQPWKTLYWNIQRANVVLDNAPAVEFNDPAQRAALIAEAKFMRAFNYFWLVRTYGGVPLLTSLEEQRQADEPRATEAEVLEQILRDASEAADDLPAVRSGLDVGRATSGAALTLLADAHRWRANAVSHSAADWQAAADAAGRVIDSGVYALNDDYMDAFRPGSHGRPEWIFGVIATGTGWDQATLWGGIYWPRNLPTGGGWAVVMPTAAFYNGYIAGDYRKEATFWTEGCPADGPVDCADPVHFTPRLSEGRSATEFPGISSEGYPHVNKYVPSDRGLNFWEGNDVNVPLYRYAEVLLIYAEAQNELGNAADAADHVNLVRARARNGTGSEARAEPADIAAAGTDALRDVIYQERAWELSYELKRWFDLVQRGEQYFVEQLQQNDPLADDLGNVEPTHMRLPIPAEEIQKNPAIAQNPGY